MNLGKRRLAVPGHANIKISRRHFLSPLDYHNHSDFVWQAAETHPAPQQNPLILVFIFPPEGKNKSIDKPGANG